MKIKQSKFDILINILCLILLLGIVIYLIMQWDSIPSEVPLHYNGAGEIDRVGGKNGLLIPVTAGWIIYLFVSILECFPKIWNTGVAITEENKERVYRLLKNMLGTVKLLTVADFVYLSFKSLKAEPLSVWFLPIFLILLFGSIIYYIIKLFKVK